MQPPSLEEWIRDTFARRDETISRADARTLTEGLLEAQAERNERMERRLHELEDWRSNIMGRTVGLTIIGAIFVAVCASVITRLIIG